MQDQNAPPDSSPPENVPLEERGGLSRTHLYILLAILAIAILGLCGYIVLDYYQSEEGTTTQPNVTTTTETEELEEEANTTTEVENEIEESSQSDDIQCETDEVKYDENELISFCYPSTWEIRVGNTHAPNFPENTIIIASGANSADISIMVDQNDLDIPIGRAVVNFIERTSGSYDFPEPDSASVGEHSGVKLDYYVTSVADTSTYERYTAVRYGDNNYYIRTGFVKSLMSGEIIDEHVERLSIYEQLIESISLNK